MQKPKPARNRRRLQMEPGSLAEVVNLQGDIRVPQSGGAHDDDDRRVGL